MKAFYRSIVTRLKTIDWHSNTSEFFIALTIALSLTLCLDWAKYNYLNTEDQEESLDDLMGMQQERGGQATVPPMVFFNIDEMTYETMQQIEPRPLLSRAVIRGMLQGVLSQSPEMVMVDYAFDFYAANTSEDNDLVRFLEAAGGLLGEKAMLEVNPGRAVILLGWGPNDGPYHDVVSQSSMIYWVGVRTVEDVGGMTRRISHWDLDCREGRERLVPGIQWMASALLHGDDSLIVKIEERFSRLLAENEFTCDELSAADSRKGFRLTFGDKSYQLTGSGIDTRIQYTMGWSLDALSPEVEAHRPDGRIVRGPLLENVPALATILSGVAPPSYLIKDRLVFIGSANKATRDHFETPLGYIPGSILLANAVKSFTEHGALQRASIWNKIFIVSCLTILAFLYFHYCGKLSFYDPIIFKQIFLLFSAGCWGIMNMFLVGSGTWVDVLFPQYAVALYFVREDLWEAKERIAQLTKSQAKTTLESEDEKN